MLIMNLVLLLHENGKKNENELNTSWKSSQNLTLQKAS